MKRKLLIAVLALVGAAAAAIIWFLAAGNVGAPTQVTAPAITSAASTTSVASPTASEATAASSTTSPSTQAQPQETTTAASQPEATDSSEVVELELSEGSEVRFLIQEDLRGEPFTVVGTTTEVVGRVRMDFSDPARSQMGDILINARTFATDSPNRDRAIRGPILAAEQYEFITFSPLEIIGLPEALESGGEWRFTVEGELTVREVTRPVTFEVTARFEADGRLVGEASATVLRSDLDLSIPSIPFVANVADEIGLEFDFVATRSG